jgi:protein gp37
VSDKTGIEWTDATWNPVTGCTKVSPGCDHCYAETLAERFRGTPGHYFEDGFDVQLRPDKLDLPLRWRKPRKVFVNSMSDLFHDQVPDEYIASVFAVMAETPQHTYQVLTKRHARMRSLLGSPEFVKMVDGADCGLPDLTTARLPEDGWDHSWPLRNVWLGVSVENQQWADIRIPALMQTPAATRFLSCEPLLGPIDLRLTGTTPSLLIDGTPMAWRRAIDWVIVGGESGRGARPMHPDWAQSLRDQCIAAGVPFLFKQWGEWIPNPSHLERIAALREPGRYDDSLEVGMYRVGKKAAGRELDGRTWDQYPAEPS